MMKKYSNRPFNDQCETIAKIVKNFDNTYKQACKVNPIKNIVRVEQGEYAVLSRENHPNFSIGTHHVTPCVVICVSSDKYFGMAHFDSYRIPNSLENFFENFKNDNNVNIQMLGGKSGTDPLRTGPENKDAVSQYIQQNLPKASVNYTAPPETGFINIVLYEKNNEIKNDQFGTGVKADSETGATMRLIHNIGGMITAMQSNTAQFIPLNFTEAYTGEDRPFLLDRLALKGLQQYKPVVNEEALSWSLDPGGAILNREMRMSQGFIQKQVNYHKNQINKILSDSIDNNELQQELLAISPIYLGPHAEEANEKIATILIEFYQDYGRDAPSKALFFFNQASQYPLIPDIIPKVEKLYDLQQGALEEALLQKFGDNIHNMAYGVDITANDIVLILNKTRQEKNPGYPLIQILKRKEDDPNINNTGDLVGGFCNVYNMNFETTLNDISQEFNERLKNDENATNIINILEEKNQVSKNNVLQAVQEILSGSYLKLAEKKLNEYWSSDELRKPLEVVDKLSISFNNTIKKTYLKLAKVTNQASLEPVDVETLKGMSFMGSGMTVEGIMGLIIRESIEKVLSNAPQFVEDTKNSAENVFNSAVFTKLLREQILYKNDKDLLMQQIDQICNTQGLKILGVRENA